MDSETVKQRTIGHIRYWVESNCFRMGEHDIGVLRAAIDMLDGKTPSCCPGPLPPPTEGGERG